jgi:alpha-tubulin suppressor-like RCC1 family protein
MMCGQRVARVLRTASALFFAAGCSQDISGSHAAAPPSPLNVSNTHPSRDIAGTTPSAGNTSHAAFRVASASDPGSVAYVSLAPQTYPAGTTAVVTNLRSHAQVSAPMIDGGLDPVPVPALDGDSVEIAIASTAGAVIATLSNVVPKRQPPHVVRTIPGRGKTGVPLNKIMEIIFSEPVSQASLSSSSIELLNGNERVEGTVETLAGVTAAVVFQPTSPLKANTEYQLAVTPGVRDLDGDALDSTVTIPFTTGTTLTGSVESLSMIPRFIDVRVGDQIQLVAFASDANGVELTGLPVTWYCADTLVATITSTGLVTARGEGIADVLAQVGNYLIAGSVFVSNSISPAASVTLSADSATVDPGGSVDIAAIVKDAGGNFLARRLVSWTSTNAAIATVTVAANNAQSPPPGSGELVSAPRIALYWARVSGVAKGTTRIVATVDGVSDTVALTVVAAPPIVGLALSADTATLLMHANTLLSALSVNSGGGRTPIQGVDVQWESSNTQVVTVDAGVLGTGGSPGTATITAHWNGFSASARVTVFEVQFSTLSAGQTHTCAIATNNQTYCWGADDFGQVGRPALTFGSFTLVAQVHYPTPTRLVNAPALGSVSAGGFHSCGITTTGAAYCWGYGAGGALGSGKFEDSWSPVPVVGGLNFTQVDAGAWHTCALTATGAAYCWGSNTQGQLGARSDPAPSATPIAVSGGLAFTSLSAGGTHTCGLTADGTAYCWGDNAGGQLGFGNTVTTSPVPVPVSGALAFASISAGVSHTCGVTRDAALYCWGWNFDGQLGNGATQTASWTPVRVSSGLSFTSVAAGGSHTCAIAVGGAAYCWGRNDQSQLGIGTSSEAPFATPQRVATDLIYDKLSTGRDHTCASAAGVWYCWGDNESGILGSGSLTNSSSPIKVLGQP